MLHVYAVAIKDSSLAPPPLSGCVYEIEKSGSKTLVVFSLIISIKLCLHSALTVL